MQRTLEIGPLIGEAKCDGKYRLKLRAATWIDQCNASDRLPIFLLVKQAIGQDAGGCSISFPAAAMADITNLLRLGQAFTAAQ